MPRKSPLPLRTLSYHSRESLASGIRACRSAIAMFEPSEALQEAAKKLMEAEMWLKRAPAEEHVGDPKGD